MSSAAAIIGGTTLAGGLMSYDASQKGARAIGAAADAQAYQAQVNYNQTKQLTDKATTAGIASYEKDLQNQDRNLSRQEQLISQIDPTIIEASQQALKLLKGESSSTLAPMQNQRAMQRQKLLASLREQLGPGAETSTAGIQALTRFDAETNNLLSGQQQQAIGLLGQTAGQFSAMSPNLNQTIQQRSQYGQGAANLMLSQAQILAGQGQNLAATAGNQYAGQIASAQGQQSFGNSITQAGGQMGMAYMLRQPTSTTQPSQSSPWTMPETVTGFGGTSTPQLQPVSPAYRPNY